MSGQTVYRVPNLMATRLVLPMVGRRSIDHTDVTSGPSMLGLHLAVTTAWLCDQRKQLRAEIECDEVHAITMARLKGAVLYSKHWDV